MSLVVERNGTVVHHRACAAAVATPRVQHRCWIAGLSCCCQHLRVLPRDSCSGASLHDLIEPADVGAQFKASLRSYVAHGVRQ